MRCAIGVHRYLWRIVKSANPAYGVMVKMCTRCGHRAKLTKS